MIIARLCRLIWGLGFLAVVACGGQGASLRGSGARTGISESGVPAAEFYSTAPAPHGVVGGGPAEEIAKALERLIEARGDAAEADGALAALGAWMLAETRAGRSLESIQVESRARDFGFAGVLYNAGSFALEQANLDAELRGLLDVPANHKVTRYAVVAAESRDAAVVVVGAVEATLDDFARRFEPGETIHLEGEVARRFERASVIVTESDGSTRELLMPSRKIDVRLVLDKPGVQKLEVMGLGSTGPTVLINVPVYVGVSAAPPAGPAAAARAEDPSMTPERAEERLLELLNEARAKAGAGRVEPDPELRAVALAHSRDMSEHNFMGHVSPLTGTPDDRVARAGLRVAAFGENVAAASGPESAHETLMASPGHRANMIRPSFTHVGVAVAPGLPGQRRFLVTLLFARRPPASAARQTAGSVLEAIRRERAARRLTPAREDPVLRAAAEAGMRVFLAGKRGSRERALDAAARALQAHVTRTRQERPPACGTFVEVLESAQLADVPAVVAPQASRMGLAVSVIEEGGRPRLAVVLLIEGTHQTPIHCG
jgi:uncharacterized protein YkwD